jgi:HTH-type transcriptional regulator/antitoxin MqsA
MTMKCPVCGESELLKETRDLPYTCKDQTTVILGVSGEFCPACNESVLDLAESNRVMHEMQAFSRLVNAPQKAANA